MTSLRHGENGGVVGVDMISAGLIEVDDSGAHLVGGREKRSGRIVFPLPQGTSGDDFEPIRLSSTGRLWSWTVQRFRPKSPPYTGSNGGGDFVPYAVGYVELPGEIIVESRLIVDDFSVLRIGLQMKLVVERFTRMADLEPVLTYAFSPAESEQVP